ncbi:hypothetical protein HPB50_011191 [Hyalomma asiaticum]|uniref:Uncharacterized protein n=1 Tax=Hyalomma asiaticum TaxID=266040 RepID=A0ACB7S4E9_HYAAI|nr:hypothetical protein HPB50_011191 [Hyalomma asiaticum]
MQSIMDGGLKPLMKPDGGPKPTEDTDMDETRIVEYAIKRCPNVDRHKHSRDLEAIAVHRSVTGRFHQCLKGLQHFEIYTDNLGRSAYYLEEAPAKAFRPDRA